MWVDILNTEERESIMLSLRESSLMKQTTIYPEQGDVFKAFTMFPLEELKVIWIGQDPYHDGKATGLSMGIKPGDRVPPTLKMLNESLKKEYGNEIEDLTLESWAKQGILLLNSALTVEKGKPGSHTSMWKNYIINVLRRIAQVKPEVIWVALGKHSKDILEEIGEVNRENKIVAPHPMVAIYSGDPDTFLRHKIFTRINEKLKTNNLNPIKF